MDVTPTTRAKSLGVCMNFACVFIGWLIFETWGAIIGLFVSLPLVEMSFPYWITRMNQRDLLQVLNFLFVSGWQGSYLKLFHQEEEVLCIGKGCYQDNTYFLTIAFTPPQWENEVPKDMKERIEQDDTIKFFEDMIDKEPRYLIEFGADIEKIQQYALAFLNTKGLSLTDDIKGRMRDIKCPVSSLTTRRLNHENVEKFTQKQRERGIFEDYILTKSRPELRAERRRAKKERKHKKK